MEEKPKRKAISKKLRFEVFKRDSFTCQYCGRKAPDVVLEVDHIKPVAEGGKNTLLNLVTSCMECNRGKGKRILTKNQELEKERKELENLQERREQLKMMAEWKNELEQIENEQIKFIERILFEGKDEFSDYGRRKIKMHIRRFGFDTVSECSEIASLQYGDFEERFRKLGGICFNRTYRNNEG